MPRPQSASAISEEEYLNGEADGAVRHEYVNGHVYAMAGASDRHNLITLNAGSHLNTRLPDECQVFVSDMKVRIETRADLVFYYPDVMVCCDDTDRAAYHRDRPVLIIEVISPATERQDRFEKFLFYQQIPSLREYLLLSQEFPEATLFRRSEAWNPTILREGTVKLASVGLEIDLMAFYRRVRFA